MESDYSVRKIELFAAEKVQSFDYQKTVQLFVSGQQRNSKRNFAAKRKVPKTNKLLIPP
jgi:hypothetical protein